MPTKQFIGILIYPFCLALMLGCTMRVGKKMEDGTYLTLNGEAVSYYIGPYDLTLQSGLQVLSSMEMPIHERRKVRDGIVIRSETRGGSPLRLQFIKEGRAITMVKIRTGRIGYWDNSFSYQLHALMKAQLNRLNRQSAQLKRMNQKQPVREPYRDIPSTAASPDIRTATSADKPSATAKAPSLKPEAAKSPNEENSERKTSKTIASVSGESLPIVKSVSELPGAKPTVSIFFGADSNLPAEEELTKLDRIALQALSNLNTKLALTGYAGEFDDMDQAELLAKSRVMAVKYYLIGKGVAADQIVAVPQTVIKKEQTHDETYRRVEIRIYTEP
jgi:outer membrane protein OmpA-like peptidoglycan-associated protein